MRFSPSSNTGKSSQCLYCKTLKNGNIFEERQNSECFQCDPKESSDLGVCGDSGIWGMAILSLIAGLGFSTANFLRVIAGGAFAAAATFPEA